MLVRIETQSRKKAKLNRYMDIMDFQILLLSGLVLPFSLWLLFGLTAFETIWLCIGYILWMSFFKINKPSGYWSHWLSYQMRGKLWTGYNGQLPHPAYPKIRIKKLPE